MPAAYLNQTLHRTPESPAVLVGAGAGAGDLVAAILEIE